MHFNINQYGVTYIILIIEDLMIEENGIGLLRKKRKEIVIIKGGGEICYTLQVRRQQRCRRALRCWLLRPPRTRTAVLSLCCCLDTSLEIYNFRNNKLVVKKKMCVLK
jgi:hypothetical protein